MRIAFVIPSLAVGGAERSLIKLLQVVAPLVDRIDVICFATPDVRVAEPLPGNVNVISQGGLPSSCPLLWIRVGNVLRALGPDIVVGWSTYANFVAVVASRVIPKARLILCERNYVPQMYSKATVSWLRRTIILHLIRRMYRRAQVVTANSTTGVRFLRRYVGGSPQYKLLPNTIDVASAISRAGNAAPDALRARSEPRILAIGRLDCQKGFDVLLRAFAIIRVNHPEWSLVLVGDGPQRESLRSLATELGLAESVCWVGQVSDPFPYYGWAEIVVVPSRFEGFPNVPLEAMSLGKAVICSDCKTGPRELTDNGRHGRLVPVGDAVALAREIVALVSTPDAGKALGASAREFVLRAYDVSVMRRRYPEVLGLSEMN